MSYQWPGVSHGFVASPEVVDELGQQVEYLSGPVIASLRQSTSQNLTNNVSTAINMNVEDDDTANGHDNTANNSRYTIQSGRDGRYLLNGGVGYQPNATGIRVAEWRKNGLAIDGGLVQLQTASAGVCGVPARGIIVPLVAGDYIELWGYQNSGGTLGTEVAQGSDRSCMHILRVSD